ncbi:MAG TPA: aspartate/glutamate racemase family protein, partial [Patescibacteria group bacterium]|nr:aspartate/glutamate racemase family protein [Patescibacteria group bacterium]
NSLKSVTAIPFVSIIDEVSEEVRKSGFTKIGLLGSPNIIESDLYQKTLSKDRIKVVTPSKLEQLVLEDVIRNILAGKILERDKKNLMDIAESLALQGAEVIILGCTELPLIFPANFPLPAFNTTEILARKLLITINK